MRRGLEADFDPDKMRQGEWAVSTDKKYVRMCFSPGVCVRMATYDAFEADVAKIQGILEEVQTIEEAVTRINTEISKKANAVAEYTEQAKQYRDEAKQFRDEAEQFAPEGYVELQEAVASNTAKIDTIIEKAELNIKNIASGENIHLTDSASSKVVEFGLYGKATQDGEPTPDNPIEIVVSGSDGSVEVVSCGKNLLENTASTMDRLGITFTVNDDGSVTASGTATDRSAITVKDKVYLKKVGAYKLSGCPNGGSETTYRLLFGIKKADGTFIADIIDYGNGASFSITQEMIDSKVYGVALIYVFSGYTANNLTFKPMIRLASDTDDTYEPYKETVSTISTPNGLSGIKVSSGGNYTDENGQQWICDEVVKYADGSGKRIQRVGKAVLNGNEVWNVGSLPNGSPYKRYFIKTVDFESKKLYTPVYCSHFTQYSMNAWYAEAEGIYLNTSDNVVNLDVVSKIQTVEEWKMWLSENTPELYYILATPIITPLTAEEIAEIEKLHTFYPITNISNDADCGMAVTYMADAKNYIDNRLALLETALVNSI